MIYNIYINYMRHVFAKKTKKMQVKIAKVCIKNLKVL